MCVDNATPTKPDLEDYWKIEAIGIHENPRTTNDELVKKNFKEILEFQDKRYQVSWPWREVPDLPVNRELAMGRLKSVILKMRNKPGLMEKYDLIIKDQLDK